MYSTANMSISMSTPPHLTSSLLTPPPLQRQHSLSRYTNSPINRQIPLNEMFANEMNNSNIARKHMVRGALIELTYIFVPLGTAGKIPNGTTGRISRRRHGGWLQVKFECYDKCVNVRTCNCKLILKTTNKKSLSIIHSAMEFEGLSARIFRMIETEAIDCTSLNAIIQFIQNQL